MPAPGGVAPQVAPPGAWAGNPTGAVALRRQRAALVAVVALATLPGWAMIRVYGDGRSLPLCGGIAVLAVAVASLGGRRAGWAVTVPASAVLGLAYLAVAVAFTTTHHGLPTGATLTAVGQGLVHGWSRLLTSALPVGVDPVLLVPAVVLSWASAAAGAELVLRTDTQLAAGTPATAALIGATVLAASREASAVAVGVAYLVATAVLLRARAGLGAGALTSGAQTRGGGARAVVEPPSATAGGEPVSDGRRPAGRNRRPGRSAPVVAGTAAAAVVVVAAVAGPGLVFGRDRHPYDPRQHLQQPTDTVAAVSPLDLIGARLQHPGAPLFTVQATEAEDWQQTVLDTFDGYDWTASTPYQGGGTAVPAPVLADVTTTPVRQDITIQGLSGPWLPAAARPTLVEGSDFRADPSSGALVATSGTAAGAHYTVTSEVPAASPSALQVASVATDPGAIRDTDLPPGLPTPLGQIARVATAGAQAPFTQALLLERYLRLVYHVDIKAAAGHSYGHLLHFLTVTKAGTSEQFATAFAVLGRVVGLPTRVVVGFSSGRAVGPGRYQVDSGDAKAWPEVDFSGLGWVPFDPTPTAATAGGSAALPVGGSGSRGQQSFVIAGSHPTPTAPPATVAPSAPSGPTNTPAVVTGAGGGSPVVAVLAGVAGVVAVLVLGALTVVAAKRRRLAARRHTGDARARVAGAWTETLDRLGEAGVTGTATLTVAEIVAAGDAALGARARALTGLYRPVNQALYDPTATSEEDADRAWRSYDRLVADVATTRSPLRRLTAAVDPRPLRRTGGRRPGLRAHHPFSHPEAGNRTLSKEPV